jgi:hypothetical protein
MKNLMHAKLFAIFLLPACLAKHLRKLMVAGLMHDF